MRGGRGLVAQSSLTLSHKSVLNGLQTFEHQELSPNAMQKALGLQLTRNQSKPLVWLHNPSCMDTSSEASFLEPCAKKVD